jgi:hypothetical protein
LTPEKRLFEVARLLVRFDYFACRVVKVTKNLT